MPGGKICSIAICRSNSKTAKEKGQNINFFSFPKDPEICKEWVKRCFRKDPFSPRFKRVCSKHFTRQDFEDGLKASLMGTQPRRLKKTAIPSVLIDPSKLGCEESLVTENYLKLGEAFAYSPSSALINDEEEIILQTEVNIQTVIPSLLIDPSKLKHGFAYSQNAENIILETGMDESSDNSFNLHQSFLENNVADEEGNIFMETIMDNEIEADCNTKSKIYLPWEVGQKLEALEKENGLLRKKNYRFKVKCNHLKIKVAKLQQQLND